MILVGTVLLMLTSAAIAQDTGKPAAVVTKVYDVRDLLWNSAKRGEVSSIVDPTKIGLARSEAISVRNSGVGGGEPAHRRTDER